MPSTVIRVALNFYDIDFQTLFKSNKTALKREYVFVKYVRIQVRVAIKIFMKSINLIAPILLEAKPKKILLFYLPKFFYMTLRDFGIAVLKQNF